MMNNLIISRLVMKSEILDTSLSALSRCYYYSYTKAVWEQE